MRFPLAKKKKNQTLIEPGDGPRMPSLESSLNGQRGLLSIQAFSSKGTLTSKKCLANDISVFSTIRSLIDPVPYFCWGYLSSTSQFRKGFLAIHNSNWKGILVINGNGQLPIPWPLKHFELEARARTLTLLRTEGNASDRKGGIPRNLSNINLDLHEQKFSPTHGPNRWLQGGYFASYFLHLIGYFYSSTTSSMWQLTIVHGMKDFWTETL